MDKRKKVYYPDAQIQKGLYTNGKEYMFTNGIEYIGDYHKYTTGEVFTKSTFLRGVSKRLISYIDLSIADTSAKFKYDSLNKFDATFNFAIYGKSIPLELDYGNGYFLRYFVKRHFNDIVTEVTKDVYSTLTDKFYQKVEVRWKLVDNAAMVNRKQIQLANESVIGLSNYITNYTEFLIS